MKLFRIFKSAGEPLAVSMAGIKLGDRLLMLGCGDPLLVSQLAVKTGLTGRAFAIDARAELASAAAALAPREGALIETATSPWASLPLDSDSFDVAVVRDVFPHLSPSDRVTSAREVHRVLRGGGRCLVIDTGRRSGVEGILKPTKVNADYAESGGAVHVLEASQFRAARVLAERDALIFCEAAKPNA